MADTVQFTPGDVVQLKSGGPKMTVAAVETGSGGRTQYICEWFDKDFKRLSAIFTAPVLMRGAD